MQISGGRFVVTGGASLIGSHVADRLLAEGAREVVLLDNFSLGTPETVAHLAGDDRVKLLKGDILRINELYDAFKGADGVFAIAGFLTLPLTQNPPLGLAVNVEGQVNVFEACRYAGVKKVVFSSSIAAYGEPEGDAVIDESFPANLASYQPGSMLYSCTKLIGEALCKLYSQKHGVHGVALRYSTVFGERQHYRGVNALYIIQNYDKIMRGEAPVLPGDGSEVHDYIHVADVARANVMAMASEVTGEVFNVVTGVETTVKRIAEIVLDVTGSDLQPVYADEAWAVKATSSQSLKLSREKIKTALGWEPQVSVEEGIRRLIAWRKEQPA
ncbi:NAD-dependent epimerase/dehydratase family protein [Novosphingobium sp. G106]|uniref:NAD-dependent epimerase/dehydratase family protein n=1 Tax=Novosphingobium sp. G106 TaxID=2849500 RepID=UPI001C2D063D|nr:NAD-dependent epimerase/dehydratase family protein [Novosphingobium sp. G106]MBV1690930.1 NAD-dependent epimerase/dehydratase family protein [Novosphingobium sp. G106]